MNRLEEIKSLEERLAQLKEAERQDEIAKREAAKAEQEKELKAIKSAVEAFNEKYDTTYALVLECNSDALNNLFKRFGW